MPCAAMVGGQRAARQVSASMRARHVAEPALVGRRDRLKQRTSASGHRARGRAQRRRSSRPAPKVRAAASSRKTACPAADMERTGCLGIQGSVDDHHRRPSRTSHVAPQVWPTAHSSRVAVDQVVDASISSSVVVSAGAMGESRNDARVRARVDLEPDLERGAPAPSGSRPGSGLGGVLQGDRHLPVSTVSEATDPPATVDAGRNLVEPLSHHHRAGRVEVGGLALPRVRAFGVLRVDARARRSPRARGSGSRGDVPSTAKETPITDGRRIRPVGTAPPGLPSSASVASAASSSSGF